MPILLPSLPRIHIWLPNIFGFKGGIQVYSAVFLQTLQSLYPQSKYDVFLKHDVSLSPPMVCLPDTRFHFAGAYPLSLRTLVFAAQLISQGILRRPDLIITTHLNFTVAAHWLNRLAGIPYWTVAHGVEAWNIKAPALQSALQSADRILCVSGYTRDRLLQEQQLDPQRVVILPNTVDTQRFQIGPKPVHLLQKYHLKPDQPVILTVNRLCQGESYKGYDYVLDAIPKIRQVIPDIHYLIVGKGDDRPRLEQRILHMNLQDCVTLAGFVADEALCDYYNLCDVFAMPSKLEGFGIVYLEAMACGKPTLGGNQDGAIDALCHGELGALVDPQNIDDITQTLLQLIQRSYPNPLIYQPEKLRQAVIDRFGTDCFRRNLAKHLEQFCLAMT